MTEQIKICAKCKKPFPATLEFFHSNRSHPDGLGSYCKACQNGTSVASKNRHRAKVRAAGRTYMAKWAKEHPEEKKARAAAYYDANSEGRIAYSAAYAAANPEKVKEMRAEWYGENPLYG